MAAAGRRRGGEQRSEPSKNRLTTRAMGDLSAPVRALLALALVSLLLLALRPGLATATSYEEDETSSPCKVSIFDTRVPIEGFAPDEELSRLTRDPSKHPKRDVCKSYAGKASCCTSKSLENLRDWSEAVDSSFVLGRYLDTFLRRNPKALVDRLFALLAAYVEPVQNVEWNEVRKIVRDDLSSLLNRTALALRPEIGKLSGAIVTYQEGLLCSGCEPRFERFLNASSSELRLRPESALEVSNRFLSLLQAWDIFLFRKDTLILIKTLVGKVCKLAKKSMLICNAAEVAANVVLTQLSGKALRAGLCGQPPKRTPELPDAYDVQCQEVIRYEVLRGLMLDPVPMIKRGVETLGHACAQTKMIPMQTCAAIDKAAEKLAGLYVSYDERPIAKNVYDSKWGYDVTKTGCDANLSGFACGGTGPHAIVASEKRCADPWRVVGMALGVVVLVLVIGACISRFQRRAMIGAAAEEAVYVRVQDGSGGTSATQPILGANEA